MHLWVKGRDRRLNESVRELIKARGISKLLRTSKGIRSIAISIRDVNGPRGGCDHAIGVVVRLEPAGNIIVRHRDCDAFVGVPIAIKRAIRAVRREQGRRRSKRLGAQRRSLASRRRAAQTPLDDRGLLTFTEADQ